MTVIVNYVHQQSHLFGKETEKENLIFYHITLNKSVILIKNNSIFEKSTAVIPILNDLGGIWKIFTCLFIVPEIIRDIIYDIISNKRYTWFGKNNDCELVDS